MELPNEHDPADWKPSKKKRDPPICPCCGAIGDDRHGWCRAHLGWMNLCANLTMAGLLKHWSTPLPNTVYRSAYLQDT